MPRGPTKQSPRGIVIARRMHFPMTLVPTTLTARNDLSVPGNKTCPKDV